MDERSLETLGYGEWNRKQYAGYIADGFSPARVIEVNRNRYVLSDGVHEMSAELTGKFMYDAQDAVDLPTVGDWVLIQTFDDNTMAIVHAVLPRKTLLKRKESGKRVEFQLIAANIDFGLVVQSAAHLNPNLLDRYFVMLNDGGIEPMAVFSKIDLLSPSEQAALTDSLSRLKNRYLLISNTTGTGVEELSKSLIPGKTYCLLGQSGVGKTTLLNTLLGEKMLTVNEVRQKDGKGRHTTTRRQLIRLDSGSIFIDTPGIRELGNFEIEDGLDETFDEFSSYISKCRFRDCTHTHEEGCAVIEAVEKGDIEEDRYRNYLKLRKESEFYGTLYHEKRKKDKAFGKMLKNYKKQRKDLE